MSPIRYTSSPPLRRLLQQGDYDGFEVLPSADGPGAQLLGQSAPKLQREDKPDVVGRGPGLGSAGNGELGGLLRVEDAPGTTLRGRRERKLGLSVTGAVGLQGSSRRAHPL